MIQLKEGIEMNKPVLGIDISKLKFNICLINSNQKPRHKVFPNTLSGFEQLITWLSEQNAGDAQTCLEATGTYGEALALFLLQAGYCVSVVDPAAVKAFAGAGLSRTRNR